MDTRQTSAAEASGGEEFLHVLAGMGIDHIFASPGSEWAPAKLVESCVKWSFTVNANAMLPSSIQRACQIAMARLWGHVKVRYRDIAKNYAQICTLFTPANLYRVRHRLLATLEKCVCERHKRPKATQRT